MQFLQSIENPWWLPKESTAEAYLSNDLPPRELCVSVYGFVMHDGHILFTRGEADHTHKLELPGGHIENGETPEEALVRELIEETGVTPESYSLVIINKTEVPNPPAGYPYPTPTSYMLFYAAKVSSLLPTNELGVWLPLSEAKENSWIKAEQGIFDALLKVAQE
jgi:8-oxo-dGTP diphosphatase